MEILLTGYIGLEGTAIIAREKEALLARRFPRFFIESAKSFAGQTEIRKAAGIVRRSAPEAEIRCLSEGGLFSALWDAAAAYGCGFDIDMAAVPVRQETVEICEVFGINPYRLCSGGSLMVIAGEAGSVLRALRADGINAAPVGRMTGQRAKILRAHGAVQYLNRPERDALLAVL